MTSSSRHEGNPTLKEAMLESILTVLPRSLASLVAQYALRSARVGVALMGHVDTGKSTLAGRLIELLGYVSEGEMSHKEKLANNMGKGSFKYAWILDKTREERERGITIKGGCYAIESPAGCKYTLVDLPGHRNYSKNAIRGAAYAEVAVVVVAVGVGEYEASFTSSGALQVTSCGGLHLALFIAMTQGLEDLIVVCNKMDTAQYSQSRFDEVKDGVLRVIEQTKHKFASVCFVPVASWYGANIVESSPKMPWYKGPTFLEALDRVHAARTEQYRAGPLRMIGSILCKHPRPLVRVKVVAGSAPAGSGLMVLQRGPIAKERSAENVTETNKGVNLRPESVSFQMDHQPFDLLVQGDLAAMTVDREIIQGGGLVIGPCSDPPSLTIQIIANVRMLRSAFKIADSGKCYCPIIHVNVFSCEALWKRILAVHPLESSDSKASTTGSQKQRLSQDCIATIEVQLMRSVYVGPEVSRRCLFRDNGIIVALGDILAYRTVDKDKTEWRDKDGKIILDINEWETALPFVADQKNCNR